MDEEQKSNIDPIAEILQRPKQKINLDSFFNRSDDAESITNISLKLASVIDQIDAMRTDIKDIATYITVEHKIEKDLREDRLFEEQDAKQKEEMKDRVLAKGEKAQKTSKGETPQEESKGGGSFLGGILKALAVGGTLIGAAKLLGPVILPMLTKGIFTKLVPILGKAFTGSFKFLGTGLTKLFSPLTKVPLGIGKIFGGISKGLSSSIGKIGTYASTLVTGLIGGSVSDSSGPTFDSNMNLEKNNSEKDMANTLEKKGVIEGTRNFGDDYKSEEEKAFREAEEYQKNKVKKDSNNEEMKEFEKEANKLKKESAIAKETGKTDISTELKKEISDGDEELTNVEIGKKSNYDTYVGADGKTYLEGNRRNIDSFNSASTRFAKVKRLNFINTFRNRAGLPNIDPYAEGVDISDFKISNESSVKPVTENKNLDSGAITPGKRTESFTIERTTVEPIKDISMNNTSVVEETRAELLSKDLSMNNTSVVVPKETPQVSSAEIKGTGTTLAYVRSLQNPYLSTTNKKIPPELSRIG